MFRKFIFIIFVLILGFSSVYAGDEWDNLYEIPLMPEDTILFDHELQFAYRGRIGFFALPPSVMGCYLDSSVNYLPPEEKMRREKAEASNEGDAYLAASEEKHMSAMRFFINQNKQVQDKELWQDYESIKVMYRRKIVGKSFCGAYLMILGDMSGYSTLTFMIKGQNGGESFQLGMNDAISNKREDAVFIGSINRFLPGGVTRDWQMVKIPVSAFYGPDLAKVMSVVFDFNEESQGVFWIDDVRFYKEPLIHPMKEIYEKGYLYLDDFNYSYLNLLGRKTGTYKKLPSLCKNELDPNVFYGESGKSMRLDYNKGGTGWSGYYSLLNQVDGEWFDLSEFDKVSFMVKGKKGGEEFELGLADRNWVIIGDSLKAGSVNKYLPGGVTTEWQEVVIPLENFGLLDLAEMGSFVINFNVKQTGSIWVDDLKFFIKQEEEEEPDW